MVFRVLGLKQDTISLFSILNKVCGIRLHYLASLTGCVIGLEALSVKLTFWAQLFKGRLALNPGLNLTRVSFSCVQKHFLG